MRTPQVAIQLGKIVKIVLVPVPPVHHDADALKILVLVHLHPRLDVVSGTGGERHAFPLRDNLAFAVQV